MDADADAVADDAETSSESSDNSDKKQQKKFKQIAKNLQEQKGQRLAMMIYPQSATSSLSLFYKMMMQMRT